MAPRPGAARRARLEVTFVMEQHLGHGTHAANLRGSLAAVAGLHPHWIDVRYEHSGRVWERIPHLPHAVRGAMRGRHEIRSAWRRDPDVAFFNTQVPAAIAGRSCRRRPYVVSLDVTPRQYDRIAAAYGHTPDRRGPTRALKHGANRRLVRGAAAVVAWSSWVRDSLVDEYDVPSALVKVVPPGVDSGWWQPMGGHRTEGPVRILFVGGDFRRKGGEVLMTAFQALPPGSAELVLVTKSAVPSAPGVRVVTDLDANSDELRALYHASDVFALPSKAEAFGIAAVEASAAGLPVVATRVGGLTDIVADGETGVLVRAGDAAQLAMALRQLVDDESLRQRMGAAARARAVERFDAVANSRSILEILHRAAAR